MTSAELERELSRGKDLFAEVFRVTSDYLERFTMLNATQINEFEQRRQALLDALIQFDSKLKRKLPADIDDLFPEMARQLQEFRTLKEVFINIIMEKNGAIISLANLSMKKILDQLNAVSRGRKAMLGYNQRGIRFRNCVDRNA